MSQRLCLTSGIALGLLLVLGGTLASERERNRERDNRATRTKPGITGTTSNKIDGLLSGGAVQVAEQLLRSRGEPGGRGHLDPRSLDLNKAGTYLKLASHAADPKAAMAYLQKILNLDLPLSAAAEELLARTHAELADLYAYAPQKQIHHLALAGRYAASEERRTRIEREIEDLGGDPFAIALEQPSDAIQKTVGVADTCDDGNPVSLSSVGELFVDSGVDIEPGGDRDWYEINVATGDPSIGLSLRIETFTDGPIPPVGGGKDDDTQLELYTDCVDGEPDDLIGFDDDSGEGFMSRIDTGCLSVGKYYLSVGGFRDISGADNIDVEIEATGDCQVPLPDDFEPDDDKENASRIGHNTDTNNPNALFTGRVRRELQAHNVFPNGDVDWVRFQLKRPSLMRIRTACGFPTLFNNFTTCENPPEFDTLLSLWYTNPNTTYGLCNQSFTGVPGQIATNIFNACTNDLDCDFNGNGIVYPEDLEDLVDPFPGLPACLPWSVFPEDQQVVDPVDNALASSDDASFPTDLGADLRLCLPRTDKHTTSLSVAADPAGQSFNWYVKTGGWDASGDPENSTLNFDYEILVHNMADCNFEIEPNNDFLPGPLGGSGNPLPPFGEAVHGIFDFNATEPTADFDLYRFNVEEATTLVFETDGYDPLKVDTFLEIWVGPDENGDFFFTGFENDDVGPADFTSRLEALLPPACEFLDDCSGASDPNYYINVTSAFVVPNFPYTLTAEAASNLIIETEDFTDCGMGGEGILSLPSTVRASLGFVCDYDGMKLSLPENAFVRFETVADGEDTTMLLEDCDTGENLACDDDGGAGLNSAIEGCLPGGRDYCVRVRAFTGDVLFDYTLEISGGEPCDAEDPPVLMFDGEFNCADYPDSTLFDSCP